MIFEIGGSFPWVRRHRCPEHPKLTIHHRPAHKTWVMTDQGRGWLVRHDEDGYTVELDDGRLIKVKPHDMRHG